MLTAAEVAALSTELSPLNTLAIFVGIPLAAVAVIAGLVVFVERGARERRNPVRGPTSGGGRRANSGIGGVAANQLVCWVTGGRDGPERHHDQRPARARGRRRQLRAVCWTMRCAGCRQAYRENVELVHFDTPAHAVTIAEARGWVVRGNRALCADCAQPETPA